MPASDSSHQQYLIAVLPGDGIGEDVVSSALEVLAEIESKLQGVCVVTEEHAVGAASNPA